MFGKTVPGFDQFRALAESSNLIPIQREILADFDTPVSAFVKVDEGGDAFLLESVEGGEKWGRYSFIGVNPDTVIRSKGTVVDICSTLGVGMRMEAADPLVAVRKFLSPYRYASIPGLPRFSGGLVGFVSYDVVRFFEKLPVRAHDDLDQPEIYLMLANTLVVFDNVAQTIKVIAHASINPGTDLRAAYDEACGRIDSVIGRLQKPARPPVGKHVGGSLQIRSSFEPAEYEAIVRRAKDYIFAGDIIQVVLAQRFECERRADPLNIYRCLRTFNPSPYMYFLRAGGRIVLGASPEVMARVEGRELTVRPIAGTRPRGTDERQDRQLEAELCADPKEIAEHIMLVDLARNDVGRVARVGTVQVTERLAVERYSHVMHLVSNVRGELDNGFDCFDAFRATFPAGTLSGAPKIRAMEIIEELEPVRRGVYGGAVGYFDFRGNMDTAIAIRTMVIEGDRIFVQAGAGIVADSDPEREHAECVNKARALFQAVKMAEQM